MLGADAVGFHSRRWADAFGAAARPCSARPGTSGTSATEGRHDPGVGPPARRRRPTSCGPSPRPGGAGAGSRSCSDVVAASSSCCRIDRTELSKNIVRGLEAYRELLRTRPEWHEQVVHLAFAYPSRHDLPEYRAYTGVVQRVAREVNEEFARPGWLPVHLEVRDDYPRSLAAYTLADVLLVNPLRDGMNLVAKEGPVLSERGVSLVLSRQAGAADELGADAHLVNPYDVGQTAQALHEALSTPASVRSERSARLARAATALPPAAWLQAQLDALPTG
jgi:trehalose 6-phosphate synthase